MLSEQAINNMSQFQLIDAIYHRAKEMAATSDIFTRKELLDECTRLRDKHRENELVKAQEESPGHYICIYNGELVRTNKSTTSLEQLERMPAGLRTAIVKLIPVCED